MDALFPLIYSPLIFDSSGMCIKGVNFITTMEEIM